MALLFLLAFQSDQLKFMTPIDPAFAGQTRFSLRTDIDPDDIVGIEIFVNDQHAAYLEEPPFNAEINMRRFPQGEVRVKAVLEVFDGTTYTALFMGRNFTPDLEENVTLIRVPVLAELPDTILHKGDFRLYEDERPQKITMMLGEEKSMYLVVILDMSTSMEKRLILLRRAMEALIERIRPGDIMHVIGFNHRVFEVSPPETDMNKVRERLKLLEAKGNTNIYGALYSGLKILGRSNERRAVLLFTDGDHTVLDEEDDYKKNLEDCIALARENGVPVYNVGFGVRVNRKNLEQISKETGGKAFFQVSPKKLAGAFETIGRELHHQYLLCYYTGARTGSHEIRVEVPELKVPLIYPKSIYISRR